MNIQKIHFLCAGGTIDKIYFDAKSDYQIGDPAVAQMLDEMPIHFDYQISSVMRKDSLDMDDEDRQAILEAVTKCEQQRIIITHGTDTMPDTARVLAKVPGKTIVLTGAMAPAIFRDTDALFNLGCAISAVQTLNEGVYIAMNGEIFDALNVRKDVENERFVRLN